MIETTEGLFGREHELAELRRALDQISAGPAAFVLDGEAGIGKTTLWEAAVQDARGRGYVILSARAAQLEAQISLSGLDDLLEGLHDQVLPALPPPQRHALRVALLLEEDDQPPDPRAVSLAFVAAIRALAAQGPLVLAVDDLQWLDSSSSALLAFAVRRLRDEPILLLVTRRSEADEPPPLGLDRAISEAQLHVARVGPLSLGALHQLVRARLGTSFSRPVLRRIQEAAGGNPFFALEVARAVQRGTVMIEPGRQLALPKSLTMLVRERLEGLPPDTRESLLFATAVAEPSLELVEEVLGRPVDLETAQELGIVELDDGRIRFTHPLLAASLYGAARPEERREVHRRCAEVVAEPEQRARHLALAARGPDSEVAAALDVAARRAQGRGAPAAAAELAEQALALTDESDAPERARRASDAGAFHASAGDAGRALTLISSALELLPPGPERARSVASLLEGGQTGEDDAAHLGLQALEGAGGDIRLRARLNYALSEVQLVRNRLPSALEHARQACTEARAAGDDALLVAALARAGYQETLLGVGDPEETLGEGLRLEESVQPTDPLSSARYAHGIRLVWLDDCDGARPLLTCCHTEAVETGNDHALPGICIHLARLELRAGHWAAARRLADDAHEIAEQAGHDQPRGGARSVQALVEAYHGNVEAARVLATESNAVAASVGDRWFPLYTRVALGLAELSAERYEETVRLLDGLGEELDASGIREPGIFPFEADAAEALIALGRTDQAEPLIDRLEERGRELDRPRALATAARCRGLLFASRNEFDQALASIDAGLHEHERFFVPFERARTLLVLGSVQRRARQRRAARLTLKDALAEFERLGAQGWSRRARQEIGRLGGRVASPIELTGTERRVASLVAAGRTNREVAAELVISVRSVEANLTRIYRKIGIRSRTELARKLPHEDHASEADKRLGG